MLAKTPTFERFINFCREKGEEPFEYSNTCNCALAQFGKYERHVHHDEQIRGGYNSYYVYKDGIIQTEEIVVIPMMTAMEGIFPRLGRCNTFADIVREFENELVTV
jgi:hypothetical protein